MHFCDQIMKKKTKKHSQYTVKQYEKQMLHTPSLFTNEMFKWWNPQISCNKWAPAHTLLFITGKRTVDCFIHHIDSINVVGWEAFKFGRTVKS